MKNNLFLVIVTLKASATAEKKSRNWIKRVISFKVLPEFGLTELLPVFVLKV